MSSNEKRSPLLRVGNILSELELGSQNFAHYHELQRKQLCLIEALLGDLKELLTSLASYSKDSAEILNKAS